VKNLKELLRNQKVGKVLSGDVYIHVDYLDQDLKEFVDSVAKRFKITGATLVKISKKGDSLSFLFYPDFEKDPHPALAKSIEVWIKEGKCVIVDYSKRENPPILHRKECFVGLEHH